MKANSIFKTAIVIIACTAFSSIATAQFSIAPRIGGGVTISKLTVSSLGSSSSPDAKLAPNFSIGAELQYRFIPFLSVHSGIFYQMIANKFEEKESFAGQTFSSTIKWNLNYISIPLEIVYGKEEGFYGGVGANFGIGISGKEKFSTTGEDDSKSDVKFDGKKSEELDENDNDSHLKRLNAGVSLKAGYRFGKIFVGVNAALGLSDLAPDDNVKFKMSTVGVHVGYVLGGGSGAKK